jgi:CheY-like chemotaxis protein
MQGVVNWVRGKWLIIPNVRIHWPTGFPLSRSVDNQQKSDNRHTDPARPSRRNLHKTILMLALKGHRIGDSTQALERAGYEVCTVWGLSDALEAARHGHPSLIIIYSGIPATRICLALRDTTSAPILALLTAAWEADLLAALDAGADDCQPASIGAPEVLMRARVLLRRSMRQLQPQAPSLRSWHQREVE